MADTIQLRAGNKANMPTLADREPAYVRDEKALYVGTPTGNVKIGEALEAAVAALDSAMNTAIDTIGGDVDILLGRTAELEARKAGSVADVASDAELAAVIGKVNELIAALKASGLMNA